MSNNSLNIMSQETGEWGNRKFFELELSEIIVYNEPLCITFFFSCHKKFFYSYSATLSLLLHLFAHLLENLKTNRQTQEHIYSEESSLQVEQEQFSYRWMEVAWSRFTVRELTEEFILVDMIS